MDNTDVNRSNNVNINDDINDEIKNDDIRDEGKKDSEADMVAADKEICGQQITGRINIHNVPLRRSRFKRYAPMVAVSLIFGLFGGIVGGICVNYLTGKNGGSEGILPSVSQNQPGQNNSPYDGSIISRIAESVGPAIVGVDTEYDARGIFGDDGSAQGSGSGVIFEKGGLIVTNQHVIAGSKKIYVKLTGRDPIEAKLVGSDSMSDIAVIQIKADNLPTAKFGDSSKIKVGELAVAIGNPMGDQYAGSVTSGIISAVDRTMYINDNGVSRRYHLIQTDAAINPGNSGGALIDQSGEVIGINTIKYVGENVEGMGFAIPINQVSNIITQLRQKGYVSRAMLNVTAGTVDFDWAQKNKAPVGAGVDSVTKGGAADQAGIRPKDIITEIDGIGIKSADELISELEKHNVGDSIKVKLWREGAYVTISVTLGDSKNLQN